MANRRPVIISTAGFPKELAGTAATADDLFVSALLIESGGRINVGGSKINGVASPTSGTDAANKAYVDALVTGLSWKEPVQVLSMKSDAANGGAPPTPLGNPGLSYVVNNWGAGFDDGDIVETNGTSWITIVANVAGEPPTGTRVCVLGSDVAGSFTGHTNAIATYDGSAWTFEAAEDGFAVLAIGDDSYVENQGFVFDDTGLEARWVQFSGLAAISAGAGLSKSGNVINVNVGDGLSIDGSDNIIAKTGYGLTLTASGIVVTAGNGIGVDVDGVYAVGNLGISVTSAGINVKPTSGIGVSAGGVYARTGNGLTIVGGDIVVTAANGIGVSAAGVYAVGTGGIGVSAGGIHAVLGRGLELSGTAIIADGNLGISVTTDGINAKVGYGLTITASGIVVTAANGIGVSAAGVYAVGTNGVGVSAGGIHVTYGRGLTLSGTNLIADGSTGILVTADGIEVVGLPSGFWIGTTTETTNATYVTADNLNTLTDGSDASALHFHGASYSLLTAEEALAAGDSVYISSSGKVSKATASVVTEAQVIGIVTATYNINDVAKIYSNGIVKGAITGATANNTYYLRRGGGVTVNAPSISGSRIILLGYAVNATDLAYVSRDYGQKA